MRARQRSKHQVHLPARELRVPAPAPPKASSGGHGYLEKIHGVTSADLVLFRIRPLVPEMPWSLNPEYFHRAFHHRVIRRDPQPLTAPASTPRRKYFCAARNRPTTGIVVNVPSAMISPQRISNDVMNSAMPTGIVLLMPDVARMLANKNSFHDSANTKMPTEKIPGNVSGTMTTQNVRRNDAPSTQAASSISRGMPRKNERSIHTARGKVSTV